MTKKAPSDHNDDILQAIRYLKLTLPEMSKREIATTPENYAIWYEYIAGTNHELKQAIDNLEKSGTRFTEAVNADLYTRYIVNDQQTAINDIKAGVKQIINDFLQQVTAEESGLREYANTLSSLSEQVSDATDTDSIKHLISELLSETKKREEATHHLQATLDKVSQEVSLLRSEVEELNAEASTDPLTRVGNRRSFDIAIERAISNSKINSTPLALLIVDIDFFKQFNDQFGHLIGDKVLRFVAAMLKKSVKGNDTVARFGGEEFAVILPETAYKNALSVAENVRKRISEQELSDSAESIKLGSVRVSIGVALYRYGERPEEFIHRGDKCLYQAKSDGRNRVVGEESVDENIFSQHQVI